MSLVIHQSGIEAAINAQANGFSGATLSAVDLYNGNTLIKRLPLKGVQVIEPTRIYVVAVDETVGSAYDVTRMEFRTDGNVLYATAQLADGGIIQSKGPYTTLMLTEQINLSAAPGTIAPSGDLSLYAPQATEEMLGAAEIATQAEVDAGTDNTRFVTSEKLKAWWDKLRTWANIKDKPDTATRWPSWGEVTGKPSTFSSSSHSHSGTEVNTASESVRGTAEIATQVEVDAGTDDTSFVTPKKLRLGVVIAKGQNSFVLALPSWLGGFVFQAGYMERKNSDAYTPAVASYPTPFPNRCVVCLGLFNGNAGLAIDNHTLNKTTTSTAFYTSYVKSHINGHFLAIGY